MKDGPGTAFPHNEPFSLRNVLAKDAYERATDAMFLDVRHDYEYMAGHVEGSLHITLQDVPARLDEIDRSKQVIVVCQVGQRSALAADFLSAHGFDAHNLEGGLTEWAAQGFPLVTGEHEGRVVDGWSEELEM